MADLRSDTVTRPSAGMLEAMMQAPVGDDVFREDPTVLALEKKVAEMFGMEAALFFPTGTMANQVAIKVHTQPGDEVVCDVTAHVYNFEGGGIAFNSACSVRTLNGDRGQFTAAQVKSALHPDNIHFPISKLVVAENTSNKGGGRCWDLEVLRSVSETCREHDLRFHLDGARLFNAIETGKGDEKTFGALFDSISICLSKGLGAPVGSLLAGNTDFIRRALRVRKVLGGGMRQAGYLAAAGIYALDHNRKLLAEDHRRAKFLESELKRADWVVNLLPVETNIIIFELASEAERDELLSELAAANVLVSSFGQRSARLVTHLDLTDADIGHVSEALRKFRP